MTVILDPVPTAVPPQEPVNHSAEPPVPSVPPVTVSVVFPPVQMVVVPDIPVGATEGTCLVMITSSCEFVQTPFGSVQRNLFTPTAKPVTFVVGSFAFANEPEPETTVQVPWPVVGLFAANEVEVAQTV